MRKNRKFISLLAIDIKLSGRASEQAGSNLLPKCKDLPYVETKGKNKGKLFNMPEPKEGVVYVCNLLIYARARELGRRDICTFDLNKTVYDEYGNSVSESWFLFA